MKVFTLQVILTNGEEKFFQATAVREVTGQLGKMVEITTTEKGKISFFKSDVTAYNVGAARLTTKEKKILNKKPAGKFYYRD